MKLKFLQTTLLFSTFLLITSTTFSQVVLQQLNHTSQVREEVHFESPQKWSKESFGAFSQPSEAKELRDQNTKHFKNQDGSYTAFIAAGNVHYWENNRWNTIFHSIDASSNGFRNLTNSHKTYYPNIASNPLTTVLPGGNQLKDMMAMRMYFEVNGQENSAQNIIGTVGTVDFNVLTYANVYGPGIDLRLTQETTKRKMDYIIANINALGSIPNQANYIVFEEKIELPAGWIAVLEGNVIRLMDNLGVVKAVYEKPMFKDAPQLDSDGHSHSDEAEGTYVISQSGNLLTIKTKVQLDWLTDPERAFPVVIDPTVNLYPDNTDWWTGHIHTNGNSPTAYTTTTSTNGINNVMKIGKGTNGSENDNCYHSWAKFNISSIPSTCVNSVNLNVTPLDNDGVIGSGCFINISLRPLENDPVSATNADRLTDIRNSTPYNNVVFTSANDGGLQSFGLGASGITNLTSSIVSGWFGVGLNTTAVQSPHYDYLWIQPHSNASKPYLLVDYTPNYRVSFSSPTPTTFCAGQTQNVSVTVTNTGCLPWTSGGTSPNSVNFSWWGSWQAGGLAGGQDNNPRIQPFIALAPGASQTITFSVTAPSTTGTYSIQTDLVRDGVCWFRGNSAPSCGPGNIDYTFSITVKPIPTVNAGSDAAICSGQSTVLSGTVQSPTIQNVLDAINTNQSTLLSSIPSQFSFSMDAGVNSNYINDGCSDMYDGGNYINTNLVSSINYSNDLVTNNAGAFGTNGKYFTKFIGTGACNNTSASLFYWVADVNGLTSISITGNNGADGGGTQDLNTFTVNAGGVTYSCFLKRVYGASDPSINQLFLIPQPNSVTHSMGASTDNTLHTLSGLTGITRMYYMLYAGNAGSQISIAQATNIAQTFANIIPVENYTWTSNPIGFTSTIASPTVSPSVTTVYTLSSTLFGCTNSDQVTINMKQVTPPTSISGAATICNGDPITLSSVGGEVVHYPFTSDLNDISGSGLNLSGAGGTISGAGLSLTTGSSYTSAVSQVLNIDKYTIAFEMRYDAPSDGTWRKIFGFEPVGTDRSPGIWKYPSSMQLHWRHDPGNTGITEAFTYTQGQYYQVVGVKNGANFYVYIDGVLVDQGVVANPKTAGAASLYFGGAPVTLRNFKIYNGALTWYSGSCGGTFVTYGTTAAVTPTATTTYYLRTEGDCANSACVSATVTVNQPAVAPTSISATHPTHPAYCHGNTVNLTSVGGTAAGGGIVDVWYENSCNTAVEETWSTSPLSNPGWWVGSTTINSATGILNVTSTGGDPMIYLGNLSINPAVYQYVQVRYRYISGPTNPGMQVFFENGTGLAESRSQRGTMTMDGNWHYLNLDMALNYSGVNSGWSAGPTVTGLRFDFCENTGMVMEFDFFLVSEDRMVGDQTTLTLAPGNPYYPTTSTQYFTRKIDNCGATSCTSTNVNLPPIGTTLSLDNESATCVVYASETIHYYHSSGRYITSVTAGGSNLGSTVATSYVEPNYLIVPACDMPSLDIAVMQRHWVITPTTDGAATVRLPYYLSELADLGAGSLVSSSSFDLIVSPDNSSVILSKYSGGVFPAITNVNDSPFDNCTVGGTVLYNNSGIGTTNPVPSITAMYSDYSIPGFSEFWLHGASNISPLPVTLSSFAAICNESGEEVSVRWTTASEHNTSHFTVERSIDGEEWSTLGTIAAAGNSTTSLNYELIDTDARGYEAIYYRLTQFDNDGAFESFGLASAECLSNELGFELFPNPAGTEVTVLLHGEYQEGETSIHITDINGKEVKSISYSKQTGKLMTVDLRNLEPGVYLVRLMTADTNSQFVRLIKQ